MSIAKAYNSWAQQYDSNENKTRDLDRQSTIDTLSRYSFNTVLELGCGTGKNTAWLLNKASRIIGLDFSSQMLKHAREKIQDERVLFQQADLKQPWPVETEFADLVTSSLTLEHIEHLDHIFAQAHRALSEKGLFFISELHPFRQYLGSQAKFESTQGTIKLEVYLHHLTDYTQSAQQHGFQIVEVKEWFDADNEAKPPRLISFVFRKTGATPTN